MPKGVKADAKPGPSFKKRVFVLGCSIFGPHVITLFFIASAWFGSDKREGVFGAALNVCAAVKGYVPAMSLIILIAGLIIWALSGFEFVDAKKQYLLKYVGIGFLLSGLLGFIIASSIAWFVTLFASSPPPSNNFFC